MAEEGVDLSTTYMGLRLKNPLIPSASPLSRDLGTARALEDSGAAAIVMYSLFGEQVNKDRLQLKHYFEHATESYAENSLYFPKLREYGGSADDYLEQLRQMKEALEIPVVASLNGALPGSWMDYAAKLEEAGADAIELNIYAVPTDPMMEGHQVEQQYLEIVRQVRQRVKVPLALKLSPYFSSLAAMARAFDNAGANALVLFNRFYQPDIDLDNLEVFPNLTLSTSRELRLPLRWIAILHGRIGASLAATSGIDSAKDIIKLLMAGADVGMLCSSLLRHGPNHLLTMLDDLREWLADHNYDSVEALKGSMSQLTYSDPSAFERAHYMRALTSFKP